MAKATNPSRFDASPASKQPYSTLPAPNTGSAPTAASDANPPPFATLAAAQAAEGNALESGDVVHLTTGATGLPNGFPDTRFGSNLYNLQSGPYQISRASLNYGQAVKAGEFKRRGCRDVAILSILASVEIAGNDQEAKKPRKASLYGVFLHVA
ncbi:hypothetical protein [Paraburkholderia sacchari]|uniref:hypothetical protein n=1 Tax=Paraburkholderia sacchari TaxID=159450 RepID=UPI0005428235|nr:hypothetical protein [Paraburkholderia sacchari]